MRPTCCVAAYPDPPLVLWVSNNEPPDLRWSKQGPLEEQSKRYLDKYGSGRSRGATRRRLARGYPGLRGAGRCQSTVKFLQFSQVAEQLAAG